MTVPEIIAALTPYTGHFPRAAVEAAIAQREEVTPELLRALDETAGAPEKFVSHEIMLHIFATYLLAQFRDKRAYRPLAKILAAPGDTADKLFGGTITERLENILASVYDGDPEPVKRLVEGEDVDLADLERDALVPFEKKESWKREKLSSLVSDTVSEMSWWAAFAADHKPKRCALPQKPIAPVAPLPPIENEEPEEAAPETVPSAGIRRGPKIGRNDPCPCGSGKKYKKCCLGKSLDGP